ncbi:oxalate/formate antiporter [Heterostelium album PN500]|uniref:Oxalate/formate antiporter n=1 Tax=Heterostelium pallidum (strain ATCC 26659 / Pp 5 / PN500) TaxID=670386 RepID=D3BIP1_HETP5|nr:oxalate/formate antiporter [Heterostelium album PN500]EFA78665.1 oxalate/formate antiporter [Heterostelium album PN500]|eukprot:XP_020430789.1 oxalate/formate antiporter [Heterostelium album PN500]
MTTSSSSFIQPFVEWRQAEIKSFYPNKDLGNFAESVFQANIYLSNSTFINGFDVVKQKSDEYFLSLINYYLPPLGRAVIGNQNAPSLEMIQKTNCNSSFKSFFEKYSKLFLLQMLFKEKNSTRYPTPIRGDRVEQEMKAMNRDSLLSTLTMRLYYFALRDTCPGFLPFIYNAQKVIPNVRSYLKTPAMVQRYVSTAYTTNKSSEAKRSPLDSTAFAELKSKLDLLDPTFALSSEIIGLYNNALLALYASQDIKQTPVTQKIYEETIQYFIKKTESSKNEFLETVKRLKALYQGSVITLSQKLSQAFFSVAQKATIELGNISDKHMYTLDSTRYIFELSKTKGFANNPAFTQLKNDVNFYKFSNGLMLGCQILTIGYGLLNYNKMDVFEKTLFWSGAGLTIVDLVNVVGSSLFNTNIFIFIGQRISSYTVYNKTATVAKMLTNATKFTGKFFIYISKYVTPVLLVVTIGLAAADCFNAAKQQSWGMLALSTIELSASVALLVDTIEVSESLNHEHKVTGGIEPSTKGFAVLYSTTELCHLSMKNLFWRWCEAQYELQKKLVDDNPSNKFHRGHVEYNLPVMIITKILRYCNLRVMYIEKLLCMTNLQSLTLIDLSLDLPHIKALRIINSLRKVDLIQSFINRPHEAFTLLCSLPLLETIKAKNLNVTCIAGRRATYIKKLLGISLKQDDNSKSFEFPNLQKISFTDNPENHKLFNQFSFANITYLSVYLISYIKYWVPILEQLKCLVTLEDQTFHITSYGQLMSNELKNIALPATLSRIIIHVSTELEINNYLIEMGYHYSSQHILWTNDRFEFMKTKKIIFNKNLNDILTCNIDELSKLLKVQIYQLCVINGIKVKTSSTKSTLLQLLIDKREKHYRLISFRNELSLLDRDQLYKFCSDNNVKQHHSTGIDMLLLQAIDIKEAQYQLQKKLVDDNPTIKFHRGHVEYKLPVMIITKILRYCWQLSTNRHSPLFSYREALKLTQIDKQFFGIVGQMFNSVKLRIQAPKSEFRNATEREAQIVRLTNAWCPIKHIVKIQCSTITFGYLMEVQSAHLQHILSTVEKISLYKESNLRVLKAKSISDIKFLANLQSLKLEYNHLSLDPSELQVICAISSLKKINIINVFGYPDDTIYSLCSSLPLLESIKVKNLDIDTIPHASHSRIKKLSRVLLKASFSSFELPNLQKISYEPYNGEQINENHIKFLTLSNITHLSVYLKCKIDVWIPIIIQLKCVVTIKDLEFHQQSDGQAFNNVLQNYTLPPTLSRIIIRTKTNEFDPNNYLNDIGYQYSNTYFIGDYRHRSMVLLSDNDITNDINQFDDVKQCISEYFSQIKTDKTSINQTFISNALNSPLFNDFYCISYLLSFCEQPDVLDSIEIENSINSIRRFSLLNISLNIESYFFKSIEDDHNNKNSISNLSIQNKTILLWYILNVNASLLEQIYKNDKYIFRMLGNDDDSQSNEYLTFFNILIHVGWLNPQEKVKEEYQHYLKKKVKVKQSALIDLFLSSSSNKKILVGSLFKMNSYFIRDVNVDSIVQRLETSEFGEMMIRQFPLHVGIRNLESLLIFDIYRVRAIEMPSNLFHHILEYIKSNDVDIILYFDKFKEPVIFRVLVNSLILMESLDRELIQSVLTPFKLEFLQFSNSYVQEYGYLFSDRMKFLRMVSGFFTDHKHLQIFQTRFCQLLYSKFAIDFVICDPFASIGFKLFDRIHNHDPTLINKIFKKINHQIVFNIIVYQRSFSYINRFFPENQKSPVQQCYLDCNTTKPTPTLNYVVLKHIISMLLFDKYLDTKSKVQLSMVSKIFFNCCSSLFTNIPNVTIRISSRLEHIGSQFCLFKKPPPHLDDTELKYIPYAFKTECLDNLESYRHFEFGYSIPETPIFMNLKFLKFRRSLFGTNTHFQRMLDATNKDQLVSVEFIFSNLRSILVNEEISALLELRKSCPNVNISASASTTDIAIDNPDQHSLITSCYFDSEPPKNIILSNLRKIQVREDFTLTRCNNFDLTELNQVFDILNQEKGQQIKIVKLIYNGFNGNDIYIPMLNQSLLSDNLLLSHFSNNTLDILVWFLFPSAVLIQLCIGSLYSWSIYNKPIDKEVNGNENEGKGPITFYIAVGVFGFSVATMGTWLERNGPKMGIFFGGLFFSVGHLVTALGIHLKLMWLIYIGYGILGGFGLGLTYISPVSTLQKWFPDHRGLSSGFAVCGFGAGSIAFGQIPLPIIEKVGLSLNFVILGCIFLTIILSQCLLIRVPPPGYIVNGMNSDRELVDENGQIITEESANNPDIEILEIPSKEKIPTEGENEKEDKKETDIVIVDEKQQQVHQQQQQHLGQSTTQRRKYTLIQALTSKEFILIYIMFFANCLFGLVAISRLSNMIQDIFGQSKSTASMVVSVNGGFNLFGRLAFATTSDLIGRKVIFIFTLTCQAIIVGLLPTLTREHEYVAFIVVIWLLTACYGAGFGMIPALLCDLFGSKNVGACHGVILTAWSIAGVGGGLLFTAIFNKKKREGYTVNDYQPYAVNFYWILAIILMGWCIIFFVRVTPKHQVLIFIAMMNIGSA